MAYSVIDKSSSFMNTLLYTGTGASNAQTGAGFQPDMTWLKSRSATTSHYLFDSARGATEAIFPDLTDTEATNAEYLKSFDSDGFTVGTNAGINDNTATYAGWNWKAGTTSGVDFSSGDITPTAYSINTTSGIGIYHYNCTGANATMVHGLSSAPKMLITKSLGDTSPWAVWHTAMAATNYLVLNDTAAEATGAAMWNSTAPSSSVISLGTDGQTNGTGKNNIMYAFSDVKGYSKFGYFKGNGETNGPVVYCGFKPQYLVIKRYNSGASVGWGLYDNKRNGYNDNNRTFYIQSTSAEDSGGYVDFYSTGFKLTSSSAWQNSSNNYFLYMAFGQSIVGSNGVTGTAR